MKDIANWQISICKTIIYNILYVNSQATQYIEYSTLLFVLNDENKPGEEKVNFGFTLCFDLST